MGPLLLPTDGEHLSIDLGIDCRDICGNEKEKCKKSKRRDKELVESLVRERCLVKCLVRRELMLDWDEDGC